MMLDICFVNGKVNSLEKKMHNVKIKSKFILVCGKTIKYSNDCNLQQHNSD